MSLRSITAIGLTVASLALAERSAAQSRYVDRMKAITVRVSLVEGDREIGNGSGFLIGDGRHVATNFHVIADSSNAGQRIVVLNRQFQSNAEVLAISPAADLAILRLEEATQVAAAPFAAVETARETMPVWAVGYPGAAERGNVAPSAALSPKYTAGTISTVLTSRNGATLFQHDAALNPGNSGGPLFDACGRIVGVNSMKSLAPAFVLGDDGSTTVERLPSGEGIGWAVASTELLSMMGQHSLQAEVQHETCGVGGEPALTENPASERDSSSGEPGGRPAATTNENTGGGQGWMAIGVVVGVLFAAGRR